MFIHFAPFSIPSLTVLASCIVTRLVGLTKMYVNVCMQNLTGRVTLQPGQLNAQLHSESKRINPSCQWSVYRVPLARK